MTTDGVLALAGTPATARRLRPLLALVGRDAPVVSWHRTVASSDPPPVAAVVASCVSVLDEVSAADPGGVVPVGVWVQDEDELHAAAAHDVEVAMTARPELRELGAVLVPGHGLDLSRWPAVPPLTRELLRKAHGLPPDLVVAVDDHAAETDAAASLAVAAAAVVTGRWVPLAAGLGTPLVTSPASADHFGLRSEVEVEVIDRAADADRMAAAIARDPDRAAALSRRAAIFARHHLDLATPAATVSRRLGLRPPARMGRAAARVGARLDELATPPTSRTRRRAGAAVDVGSAAASGSTSPTLQEARP